MKETILERIIFFLLANSTKLKGSMNEPRCYAVKKKNKQEFEIHCGHVVDILYRIEKTRGIYLKTSDSEIQIFPLNLAPKELKENRREKITVMVSEEISFLKEKEKFESQLKKMGYFFSEEKTEELFSKL